MRGVRVKICGITRVTDALAAAEAGADALGFMFYAGSPRQITPEQAGEIIRELPPFLGRVGVFVNPSETEVRRAIEIAGIDTLQFHGEESPEFCRRYGLKVIKAFRVQDSSSLDAARAFTSETWLFDSYVPDRQGGTGVRFNWDIAAEAVRAGARVLLAGGLTPENVEEAVRRVSPFGLDVSSGVESARGVKDPAKIRAFIEAARSSAKA